MTLISNGGPPLVDDDVKRMDYVLFHIKDFLQGVRGMKFADVGAYILVLMHLYDMMGDLPDDDRWMSIHLGVDVRTWKTAKARLLEMKKIEIRGGRIWNKRVEDEITAYVKKVRAKQKESEEAKKREAEKKAKREADEAAEKAKSAQRSASNSAGSPASSPRISPETPTKSQQTLHEIGDDLSEKLSDFNGGSENPAPASGAGSDQETSLDKKIEDKTSKNQQHSTSRLGVRSPRETAEAAAALKDRLVTVANGALATSSAGLQVLSSIMMWLEAGADPDLDIVPAVRHVAERTKTKGTQMIGAWSYFDRAVAEAKHRREQGLPTVSIPKPPAEKIRDDAMRQIQAIVGHRS